LIYSNLQPPLKKGAKQPTTLRLDFGRGVFLLAQTDA
jgi:hypothetical protein